MRYQAGQKVEFKFRGTKMEGTVIRQRTIRRRKKKRELAAIVTGNPHSLDAEVVEISVEGERGYRQVGIESVVKVIGKGDAAAARRKRQNVKNSRIEHGNKNWEKAHERGLTTLDDGDAIEIQFRNGMWVPAKFKGFVKSSYNVRFLETGHSKTRTCSPEFVRISAN